MEAPRPSTRFGFDTRWLPVVTLALSLGLLAVANADKHNLPVARLDNTGSMPKTPLSKIKKLKSAPPPLASPPWWQPMPPSPPPFPLWSLVRIQNDTEREREKARRLMGKVIPADNSLCAGEFMRGGGARDGRKFVCLDAARGIKRDACLVYSAGSRAEIQFEKDVAQKLGCDVHVFDPTLEEQNVAFDVVAAKLKKFNATLHNFGLGGDDRTYPPGRAPYQWPGVGYGKERNKGTWHLRTIVSVARRSGVGRTLLSRAWLTRMSDRFLLSQEGVRRTLGHQNRQIDVLKIDVEGAEWPVLENLLSSAKSRRLLASGELVRQILIEVHFHVTGGGYVKNRVEHGNQADVVAFNAHAQEMLDQLYALGFRAWKHEVNKGGPKIMLPGEDDYVRRFMRNASSAVVGPVLKRMRIECCHELALLWQPPSERQAEEAPSRAPFFGMFSG